ncbi:OsmC family protein [Sphingobacterium sp. FBM7-1]|mgnify:CR=1 FL=1|uniref:OsmC family protein n=1 Tax=Sphingobacterium sp. FBM7-1 TaxID=2886688 RepID=UPI001D109F59|nr:OsmC family protein [Sphingobacterium sp. FBM7-1]MCC2597945.1 OsmC family protein [Sphingobacterium sp. FBM7-1]
MTKSVITKIGKDPYRTEIHIQPHVILADEPKDMGGQDLGPAPAELLLSSIGSCKAITMRMYADRKQWDLTGAEISLSISKQTGELQDTYFIKCHIRLDGNLDETQRQRLLKIADKCPIHKILSNPIVIESNLI